MKHIVLAIALVCALSSSALAGDMPTCGAPAPGEIPTRGTQSTGQIPMVPGNLPSTGSQSTGLIPSVGATSLGKMPGVALSLWLAIFKLAF